MMEDLVQMTESSIVPAFGEQGKVRLLEKKVRLTGPYTVRIYRAFSCTDKYNFHNYQENITKTTVYS